MDKQSARLPLGDHHDELRCAHHTSFARTATNGRASQTLRCWVLDVMWLHETRLMTQAWHRVLVVEDEPDIRAVLRTLLQTANYRTIEAETAARAMIEARTHKPDLLIVDLGLPDADGVDLIRRVRQWSPVPILVLSARTMEEQKIAALDAGADDYVAKPFSAPELLARARAALRRNARGVDQTSVLQLGNVTFDLAQRTVTAIDGELRFTPMEFRLI
jgi:two-component system KDP operon response regulator KdpE